MRFFIEIAFKGTAYHGWQVQENATTVQGTIDAALATLLKRPVETVGAGRTDTGVHAEQMFAHFDLHENTDIGDPDKLLHQLNRIIPEDIFIRNIFKVDEKAHARFDATSRTYEYRISLRKDPFLTGYAWFLPYQPDIELMNKAAQLLFDYKDFSCFSKSNTQVFTNNCRILKAEWRRDEDQLIFTIRADRFLRNMVRAIVGTLIETGKARMGMEEFRAVLESKNRSMAGASVPACGLYLIGIEYPYPLIKLNA